MYEGQREQLYSQQFNMEQTTFALQSMQDSVHTVKAMKAAGKELKQAMGHKELNIDSIEKMQDEMADLMVAPYLHFHFDFVPTAPNLTGLQQQGSQWTNPQA